MTDSPPTAVVLCGGSARRFGRDKMAADLHGRTVLDTLLASLPAHWPVICVGDQRRTARPVTRWVREQPPGGGPVAAIAAALPVIGSPVLVLLAGDMPYAGGVAPLLVAELQRHPDVDAVAATDDTGRLQPLLAAVRTPALRSAVPHRPAGVPLMRAFGLLRARPLRVGESAVLDVDTPGDLERARRRVEP